MPRRKTISGESYSNADMYKSGNTSLLETILTNNMKNVSSNTLSMLIASSVPTAISNDNDSSQILLEKLCNTRNQVYHKAFPNSDEILSKHNKYTELLGMPFVTFSK